MNVIVLAGTAEQSQLTQSEGVDNKAFIQIHGHTMLSYVVTALRQVSEVEKVVLVGPEKDIKTLFTPSDNLIVVPEGDNLVENLRRGLASLNSTKTCLIVTSDAAFLTANAIENFLAACQPKSAAVYYPIVSRADNELRFPGVKRTYVKLIDGEFTGGNAFLIDPQRIEQVLPEIERFFALRKSPLRLAGTLGFDLILKLIIKRLSIAELEARFSTLFSISVQAVILADAELSTDVDKPEDLQLARQYLNPLDNYKTY